MLLVAKDGRQFCVARKADVQVVLSDNPDEGKLVRIVLAEGRAFSRLTLAEFMELMIDIRKELGKHNWCETETEIELTTDTTIPLHT
jgi:hypothetical protein